MSERVPFTEGSAEWMPSARLRNLPSRLLAQVAGHADRLVSDRLAEVNARKWHYAVLVALQDLGPASQSDLSRRAGLYRSDLVEVLNQLSEQGYIQRAPDPTDGRRNIITFTTQGKRRLNRLDKLITAIQEELLAPLDTSERNELIRLLTTLDQHHQPS